MKPLQAAFGQAPNAWENYTSGARNRQDESASHEVVWSRAGTQLGFVGGVSDAERNVVGAHCVEPDKAVKPFGVGDASHS
jgi:hypothetical protein